MDLAKINEQIQILSDLINEKQPDKKQYPCSKCGKLTTVPFVPDTSRPVYCYDCYKSR